MIKLIREMFFENSSFFIKILGVLTILVLLVVVWILCNMGYELIDQSSSKIYQNKGVVYRGAFVPSHNTFAVVSTGKTIAPILIRHDDAWYLDVEAADGCARIFVDKEFYDSININDSVTIQYTKGVFTKSNIYIEYIEKLKK